MQIVCANAQTKTLYDALEKATLSSVDYTTDMGFKTKAYKTLWLKQAPPIIMFQINRVSFDKETKTFQKLKVPMKFDREIYLDRFFEENFDNTMRIRQQVVHWRQQLKQVVKEKNEIKMYKHGKIGLHEALEISSDYLFDQHTLVTFLKEPLTVVEQDQEKQQSSNMNEDDIDNDEEERKFAHLRGGNRTIPPHFVTNAQQISNAIRVLKKFHEQVSSRLKELEELECELLHKIEHAYSQFPHRSKQYDLCSIIMHSGSSSESGHYWAYIRTLGEDPNKWYKFNDEETLEMNEQTVLSEAFGSESTSTSAYCLMYTAATKELEKTLNEEEMRNLIPASLTIEISNSNKELLSKIQKFNEDLLQNNMRRFKSYISDKLVDAENARKSASYTQDLRFKSYVKRMKN